MAWWERNIPPNNLKTFQISGSIKENVFCVTGSFSVKRMTAVGHLRLDYRSIYIWLPLSRLPRWHSGKEFFCQYRRCRKHGFNPWVKKMPWSGKWKTTPVLLPGKFHGRRSLVGYSPWGYKELDTTEWLHFFIHIYAPSWTSLPPSYPTHLGHHRALDWAPCSI